MSGIDVGFIGLGQMGLPIAHNILAAGHRLAVYNRTSGKADVLASAGARVVQTPLEAASRQVLVTMVSDDRALESLFFDEGLCAAMPATTVHVSSSTISLECARRLRDAHARVGRPLVTAPVVGRPERALEKLLYVLVSGPKQARDLAGLVLSATAQRVFDFGDEATAAVAAKIANNFMIGATIETLAEVFSIVDSQGLGRRSFLDFISQTLFSAPIYSIYGSLMIEGSPVPGASPPWIGLKDMRLALQVAQEADLDLPLARLVQAHLEVMIAQGHGQHDWSALGDRRHSWRLPGAKPSRSEGAD